jgi:hypothetical protein
VYKRKRSEESKKKKAAEDAGRETKDKTLLFLSTTKK